MFLPKKDKCAKAFVAVGLSTMILFSTPAMAAGSLFKIGSRGPEVSRIQEKLKELGYFKYPKITGYYGAITRDAVIRFQASKGLAKDGIIGSNTMKVLFSGDRPSSLTSRGSGGHPLLRTGDKGDVVKELQSILKNKGFYKYGVDGIFGPGTKSAVVKFQKAAGLKADGIVGSDTWKALINGMEILERGSRGSRVSQLQERLKRKGYYSGRIDGDFGPATERAVEAFQNANGLYVDGKAGPKTLALLYQENTGNRSSGRTAKTPTPVPASKNGNEIVHWDDIDSIWPRNSYAVIIDVRTGKSFKAYRSGGTNHADVETATLADTAIFKEIYGGAFSWSRRPIVVKVSGRRLAASMAGMPHAGRDDKPNRVKVSNRSAGYGYGYNYDAIKGNGMNGHFDVHFYGSRTHGSNRVDEKHQAAVREAAGLQ